jgi:hypothetical protein
MGIVVKSKLTTKGLYILISTTFRMLDSGEVLGQTASIAAKWGAGTDDRTQAGRADLTPREAAAYIADMLGELKSIANGAGLTFVAYLLAMAKAQTARSRKE